MEDQNVGNFCQFENCGKKEYFSFQCEFCQSFFCAEHRNSCPCEKPDIQKDKENKSFFTKNICSFYQGETLCQNEAHVTCKYCQMLFCISHRHEDDHNCQNFKKLEELKQEKRDEKDQF